ncbi:MAG: hypothetical protein HON65_03435 [Rhodospirillales bacterium]|jgi:hypothetical protein|nr:hypothetical protein [Rhodospirillales bacterium]
MLSATSLILVFIVVLVVAMRVRKYVRENEELRAWYGDVLKDRISLLKKIVGYGTLILWIGIWAATRGDDKASIGSLLKEISNSWTKQEAPINPAIKEE